MSDVPVNERACLTCKWYIHDKWSIGASRCGRNMDRCTSERTDWNAKDTCGSKGKYWTAKPSYYTYSSKRSFWQILFGG